MALKYPSHGRIRTRWDIVKIAGKWPVTAWDERNMHIPDGYLSPATCAVLYGGAAPFWYSGLQRVKKALHTRLVPQISLFAAFSFVIMMFNLPLPGGTSGHAVGIGLATVVLGPWAAMLAVSVAIVIQALFFGDGGITAIGANCFNMAIAGALTAYVVYRLLAGRAAIGSFRRVAAAGMAGYAAINVSALLAAIEFGIQPLLYRDASGAPLYCPYPLGVAIPAMMIGHLTIAGLAELAVSAGVVGFLQHSDPSLLKATLPKGMRTGVEHPQPSPARSLRPLWAGLGMLMILTPLGIVAAGTAWGEWMASDYSNPTARQQIAASSFNQAAPLEAPKGLEQLSLLWTAPFGRYAPPYIRSATFGYLLSAMFGVGLIATAGLILARFTRAAT
jgi:cobalt/nickel transport system permease protein